MKYRFINKLFDKFFALIFLIIFSPVIFISSLILFLELGESPFFFQKRSLSLKHKPFSMFKLKTIKSGAGKIKKHTKGNDIFLKPELDKYVPPFARLARLIGIDELPQFLNVLKGDMSIVGPRPLIMDDLELLETINKPASEFRKSLETKPGIIGLWQLLGYRQRGVDDLFLYDALYSNNKSMLLDIKIFVLISLMLFFFTNQDSVFPNKRNPRIIKLANAHLLKNILSKSSVFTLGGKEYSVDLPNDWWFTTNSLSNNQNGEGAKIYELKSSRRKKSAL